MTDIRLDHGATVQAALAGIARALGPQGWAETRFEKSGIFYHGYLARQHGEIRQVIELYGSEYDLATASVSVLFGFSSSGLHRMLCALLPEAASHLDAIREKRGVYRADLRDWLYELFGAKAQDELGLESSELRLGSMDEAEAFADRFARWWERIGKVFDSCDRAEALNRLYHSKWRLSRALFGTTLRGLLYELVLLDAAPPAASVDFDAWLEIVRGRCAQEAGEFMRMTEEELSRAPEEQRRLAQSGRWVAALADRLVLKRRR